MYAVYFLYLYPVLHLKWGDMYISYMFYSLMVIVIVHFIIALLLLSELFCIILQF